MKDLHYFDSRKRNMYKGSQFILTDVTMIFLSLLAAIVFGYLTVVSLPVRYQARLLFEIEYME
jgi:hypothetical protein